MTDRPKPTTTVEARLRIQTLASLVRFYSDQGQHVPSRAWAVRRACEDLLFLLQEKQLTKPFSLASDALFYLDGKFGPDAALSNKLRARLSQEIKNEELRDLTTESQDARAVAEQLRGELAKEERL